MKPYTKYKIQRPLPDNPDVLKFMIQQVVEDLNRQNAAELTYINSEYIAHILGLGVETDEGTNHQSGYSVEQGHQQP